MHLTPSLPETGFVRAKQLYSDRLTGPGILNIGPTLFWQLVREGRFPKPVKLSPRTTAWPVSAVREWLASKGEA